MQENIHFPPVSAWLEKRHFWRLLPVHRRLPLSLCFPTFLSLPFSFLLCCVLTCIWDPYSPSCLDQSVMLKSLPQELWGICQPVSEEVLPRMSCAHALILGLGVGGSLLCLKKAFGCLGLSQQLTLSWCRSHCCAQPPKIAVVSFPPRPSTHPKKFFLSVCLYCLPDY